MSHFPQQAVDALEPHFDNGIIDYAIINHAAPIESLRAEVTRALGPVTLNIVQARAILTEIDRYDYPSTTVDGVKFTGISYNNLMITVHTIALV